MINHNQTLHICTYIILYVSYETLVGYIVDFPLPDNWSSVSQFIAVDNILRKNSPKVTSTNNIGLYS